MRIIGVIELGTQPAKNADYDDKFKVRIDIELVGTEMETDPDKPYCISRTFNRSLHVNSDLGKFLKAIGVVIDDDEEFEMDDLAHYAFSGDVVISEDGNWANLDVAQKLRKGTKIDEAHYDFRSLYLDDSFDENVYDDLSEKTQEKIADSPEYQELFGPKKSKKKKKSRDDEEEEEDEEDDKPRNKKRGRKDDEEDEEEEEDERPSRKKRKDDDDEEEEEEDEEDDKPRRKKRPVKTAAKKKKPVKKAARKRSRG